MSGWDAMARDVEPMVSPEEEAWARVRAYDDAAKAHKRQSELAGMVRLVCASLREQMKEIEAEIIVAAGYQGIAIDGKNETIRAAQLLEALQLHDDYQRFAHELRTEEGHLAETGIGIDEAANTMRGARLVIELVTAQLHRDAAADGRAATEERARLF